MKAKNRTQIENLALRIVSEVLPRGAQRTEEAESLAYLISEVVEVRLADISPVDSPVSGGA